MEILESWVEVIQSIAEFLLSILPIVLNWT